MKSLRSMVKSVLRPPASFPLADAASQKHLMLAYQMAQGSNNLPRIQDTAFKVFSQTDEDGILLYLLAVCGIETRNCVEMCAGNGQECNTANLILNHGFSGLLFDGDQDLVESGRAFYAGHAMTYVYPPSLVHAWITRGNVNDLIGSNGFKGTVDVFSLDMDGVDYWIWEALEIVTPRIVVLEYQDILGPDLSVTVPYSDDFCGYATSETGGMPDFSGASLRAFVNLGERKGYRLVATNTLGYNAFFVHDSIPESLVPTMSVDECFGHPKVIHGIETRFPKVKDLPWVQV